MQRGRERDLRIDKWSSCVWQVEDVYFPFSRGIFASNGQREDGETAAGVSWISWL